VKIPFSAFGLAAVLTAAQIALAADSVPASDPHLQTIEMKIMSADGTQSIGATRITVSSTASGETIEGETRYLDGQRDEEKDQVKLKKGTLQLESYEHSFFSTDGSMTMLDTLNAESRIASCARREDGDMKVRKSRIDLPADTFSGGSQLLTVIENLQKGRDQIEFHAFACVPGPRVFKVDAPVPKQTEHWPLYPGNLIRLNLRPDLGAGLNMLISPFLPKTDAWFDPGDNWKYVGGEFNRYFGGPHVFQVLVPPQHASGQALLSR
jgi:hypothetical protein